MNIKKVFSVVKKHIINAATFIAAVFLYVYERISAFAQKNFKRFYKYVSGLTQKQIMKFFLVGATVIVSVIAVVIVAAEFIPWGSRPKEVESKTGTIDEGGYATVCITGPIYYGKSYTGTDKAGYDAVLSPLSDILNADVNVTPVIIDGNGEEKEFFTTLKEHGANVVSVASRGCAASALKTSDTIAQSLLTSIGQTAFPSVVIERGGISIGILSACGYKTENGQVFAFDCTDTSDTDALKEEIKQMQGQGAQYIIALLDWGAEGDDRPTQKMRLIASKLFEAGADFVCGSGSAKIMPVSREQLVYKGKEKSCYAVYSTGNLIASGNGLGLGSGSVALRITLVRESDADFAQVKSAEYIPVFRYTARENCRIIAAVGEQDRQSQDILGTDINKIYRDFVSETQDLIGDRMTMLELSETGEKDNAAL